MAGRYDASLGLEIATVIVNEEEKTMSTEPYQYIEDPFNLSRREFLTIGGALLALSALPAIVVRRMAIKRNDYIRARTAGLYKDDTISKIRVSHANQGVTRLYQDFLGFILFLGLFQQS